MIFLIFLIYFYYLKTKICIESPKAYKMFVSIVRPQRERESRVKISIEEESKVSSPPASVLAWLQKTLQIKALSEMASHNVFQ